MNIIKTKLEGCYIIEPTKFGDSRGWFKETYSERTFKEAGLNYNFVQDNMSFSKEKGILRGLHFQRNPFSQAKLVSCMQGSVYDVAVDIRKNSPTYGEWVGVELTPENGRQLLIPRGFLHGFQTLTDDVIFAYKCDNLYSKEHDGGVIYNDSTINIEWPLENPILSDKDRNQPTLKELVKREGDLF